MSTIDPTSQTQLDSILKKLGVNQKADEKAANKDTLKAVRLSEANDNTAAEIRTRLRRWKMLNSSLRWLSSLPSRASLRWVQH